MRLFYELVFKRNSPKVEERKSKVKISQLFDNSCVAFTFASFFIEILKKRDPDFFANPKNLVCALRILEVNIYPKIWRAPGEFSEVEKAKKYFEGFVKDAKAIKLIKKDFRSIKPDHDQALFAINSSAYSPEPIHCTLVMSEDKRFVFDPVTIQEESSQLVVHDWDKLCEYCVQVFEVYKSLMNVDAISKEFDKYNAGMVGTLLQLYNQPVALKEFKQLLDDLAPILTQEKRVQLLAGILEKIGERNIFELAELFPEQCDALLDYAMQHSEEYFGSLRQIMAFSDPPFNEKSDRVVRHILDHRAELLHQFVNIENLASLFRNQRSALCAHLLHRPLEKYRTKQVLIRFAKIFPQQHVMLAKAVIADEKRYLGSTDDIVTFGKCLPECQQLFCHHAIAHYRRYLVDVDAVINLAKSFPEQCEKLSDHVMRQSMQYLKSIEDIEKFYNGFPKQQEQILDYVRVNVAQWAVEQRSAILAFVAKEEEAEYDLARICGLAAR